MTNLFGKFKESAYLEGKELPYWLDYAFAPTVILDMELQYELWKAIASRFPEEPEAQVIKRFLEE